MQAKLTHLLHELTEGGDIVHQLSLDEISTCLHFFSQAVRSELHWCRKGSRGRPDKEARLWPFESLAELEDALIAHGAYQLHQLDRIDIKDILRRRVIAKGLVITGQTQQVAHSQSRSPQ